MTIPRHVIFGASVTRLAATELHAQIPFIVVDGIDDSAHGGTSYQTDGRGLRTPPAHGGLNMWDAYRGEISRGVLRPGTGDWVIMECSLGTEDLDLDAPVIDDIVADVTAKGFSLAWVIPHVYYGAPTPKQREWNARIRALLLEKVPAAPQHALIDWDTLVWAWTGYTGGLSAGDIANGQPLLYDGRHPTGPAPHPGRGAARYAAAVQAAVGL